MKRNNKEYENYDPNDHFDTVDSDDHYDVDEVDDHYGYIVGNQENQDEEDDHYDHHNEYQIDEDIDDFTLNNKFIKDKAENEYECQSDQYQNEDDMMIEMNPNKLEPELMDTPNELIIRKVSRQLDMGVLSDNQESCPNCGQSYNKVQQARLKYQVPVRCGHCGHCRYNKRR